MEHEGIKVSSGSKLQISSICSIGIRSRKWVIKKIIQFLGDVYYKEAPQDSISGALQLGITHSIGSHQSDRDVLIQGTEIWTLLENFEKFSEIQLLLRVISHFSKPQK